MDTLVVELKNTRKSLTIDMREYTEKELMTAIKQFIKCKYSTIVYKMGDIELHTRNNRDFKFVVGRACIGFNGPDEGQCAERSIPANCPFDERICIPLNWAEKYHGFMLISMFNHFNIKTYVTGGSCVVTSYQKNASREEIVNMNSWLYNLSLLLREPGA